VGEGLMVFRSPEGFAGGASCARMIEAHDSKNSDTIAFVTRNIAFFLR
jgi:hypothetical protein